MAATDRRLTILAGNRKRGRCRRCHRPVVLVVTTPHGKRLPFDGDPLVLSAEQDPMTFVRYEVITSERLHFASCPKRKTSTPAAPRDSQPRLL